ncbi:cysteine hydrolase family protein [Leptospira inadai]|uniref:cysteine hydrolase family protein n=1 Tax=Leptospira inadai TaxID=29506 RepID=UPI001EE2CF9B|nr:isochorismatase family protein [Leptospira inadai]
MRANEINTIVMFGVATSGVVLSTLRQASDTGYKNRILKDLCADKDPETHQVLMEKFFLDKPKLYLPMISGSPD